MAVNLLAVTRILGLLVFATGAAMILPLLVAFSGAPEAAGAAAPPDVVLITPEAVDDFVARCAAEDAGFEGGYAMLCGVADESSLEKYYPADGKPGIVRPYVNFRDSRQRLPRVDPIT